jgi:hypothetical protein
MGKGYKRRYDLGLKVADLANLMAVAIWFGDFVLDFRLTLLASLVGWAVWITLYVIAWLLMQGGDQS